MRKESRPLAKLVRQKRRKLRLTQGQFAALLGTRNYNVSKWEAGVTVPPGDVVHKLMELADKKS
jgi:DNA-binding transcriptional regulator YiaG